MKKPSVVDNNEEEPAADEESDNDEEPEGPLTAVESTCMLSDMGVEVDIDSRNILSSITLRRWTRCTTISHL